jgi:hypothetical protein
MPMLLLLLLLVVGVLVRVEVYGGFCGHKKV